MRSKLLHDFQILTKATGGENNRFPGLEAIGFAFRLGGDADDSAVFDDQFSGAMLVPDINPRFFQGVPENVAESGAMTFKFDRAPDLVSRRQKHFFWFGAQGFKPFVDFLLAVR